MVTFDARAWLCLLCAIFLAVAPARVSAGRVSPRQNGSDSCTHFEPSWTSAERNLWTNLCRTGLSDGRLDTHNPEIHNENAPPGHSDKVLTPISAAFLRTIISQSPYHDITASMGISLEDVWIRGPLQLSYLDVPRFSLLNSAAEAISLILSNVKGTFGVLHTTVKNIDFTNAHVEGSLFIDGVRPQGNSRATTTAIYGDSSIIDGDLMIGDSYIGKISLFSAQVKGQTFIQNLSKTQNDTAGTLTTFDWTALSVGRSVQLSGIHASSINLINGHVGESLTIASSTARHLTMNSMTVGGAVSFKNDDFSMTDDGVVDLNDINVIGDLRLLNTKWPDTLSLVRASINKNLILLGGKFWNLNGQAAVIKGAFDIYPFSSKNVPQDAPIGGLPLLWGSDAELVLDGASIGVLQAIPDLAAWPPVMTMQGITVNGFISSIAPGTKLQAAEVWFPHWLARTHPFASQPYQVMADVLRKSGDEDSATAIGYASKDRQLVASCHEFDISKCIALSMSKVLVGYGYHIWLAILWSVMFVYLGASIYRRTPEARKSEMPYGFVYSFDQFLPLIRLSENNYEISVANRWRYYFYIHKLAGWILGSFILAGLAGVTK